MSEYLLQQTLSKDAKLSGKTLVWGKKTSVKLRPAPVGQGGRFVRTDLNDCVIDVDHKNITKAWRCSKLENKNGSVSIVEHALAAMSVLNIDNYDIEIDGGEMLTFDGSAKPFAEAIMKAGIETQDKPRTFLKILRPVGVDLQDGRKMELLPTEDNNLSVNFNIDFPHIPVIGKQQANYIHSYDTRPINMPDIVRARTFGTHGDKMMRLKWLQSLGLKTMYDRFWEYGLIYDSKSAYPINNTDLHFDNECALHKALDAVGDLALSGYPIIAQLNCEKTSHHITHMLLKKLFAVEQNFCLGHLRKSKNSTKITFVGI